MSYLTAALSASSTTTCQHIIHKATVTTVSQLTNISAIPELKCYLCGYGVWSVMADLSTVRQK